MYVVSTIFLLPHSGVFHKTLMFLLKLGWKSRFRLPVLIIAAFIVMDIKMQLEIDVNTRNDDD